MAQANNATAPATAPVPQAHSPWGEAWRVFRSNKAALFGLALLVALIAMMVAGPALYGVQAFDIVGA
ncbi:MAG: hypothetical protein KGI35_02140, partial [Burkholderiales bacterium]|nr:hypothetical protein [Burkholderiales bacterium]